MACDTSHQQGAMLFLGDRGNRNNVTLLLRAAVMAAADIKRKHEEVEMNFGARPFPCEK